MKNSGKLVVISGPAGVGKGTLIKEILKKDDSFHLSVSYTTRPMRDGEINGRDYYFIDKSQFEAYISQNFFVESELVHGNYYGTSRQEVEDKLHSNNIIFEIDVAGARNVKKMLPQALLIFIQPPSWEDLEKRLIGRGSETPETIHTRLQTAQKELEQIDFFDYCVVNDRIDDTVEELWQLINKN